METPSSSSTLKKTTTRRAWYHGHGGAQGLRGKRTGTPRWKIPGEKWRPPFGQEDWAATCQALLKSTEAPDWWEMHSSLKAMPKKIRVENVGQRMWSLQKLAERNKRNRKASLQKWSKTCQWCEAGAKREVNPWRCGKGTMSSRCGSVMTSR